MVQMLWKIIWQFLKMLNIELSSDPTIPLIGLFPREVKTYIHICPYECSQQHYSYSNVHQLVSG